MTSTTATVRSLVLWLRPRAGLLALTLLPLVLLACNNNNGGSGY